MANAALEIAKQVKAPVAMAAQCTIGAAAHLAQTRVTAEHPKDIYQKGMPSSLFLLTLGDSGDGKSRCREMAFRELDKNERTTFTQYAEQKADLLEQAKGAKGNEARELKAEISELSDGRTLFDDATLEGITGRFIRGMAAASWDTDEGGQFFGGYSLKSDTVANALGAITKIYDDGKVSRERSQSNEEASGRAYNRRLTIHMLAQEIVVRSALANPLLRGQGLLPRFLFAAPESLAGTRFTDADLLIKQRNSHGTYYPHLETYWGRFRALLETPEVIEDGEVHAPLMPLSDAAIRALIAFDNRIEAQLKPLGDYLDVKAFARRTLEQAARLGAIFAFFEGKAEVDEETAHRATQIAQHSLDEWTRYSGAAVVSPVAQKAMHFMEWIHIPERAEKWREFTGREFSRNAPNSLRAAKTRNEVLAVLVEHNYLLTDGKVFRVNPRYMPATIATTATHGPRDSNHKGYSDFESCDNSATTLRQPATNDESRKNVATCRNNVAKPETPQTQQTSGLRESVADVADVARGKVESASTIPEKQTNTGWEVL